eukprot:TRINITY_DN29968_c3_g1_i1.p1 TRINITY_DN29968_c3_g1~~TRINITY_DN29968_c3_g1_i1.p1  ORF type:complete len:1097 (+),score=398.15 TRINITY_DN29968_c3_g1_i1:162-3452(+)
MAAADSESRIKVAVRCRPLSQRERYDIKCVSRLEESALVISNQGDPQERTESQAFQFDFFFDEDDNQAEVYGEAVLDLIDAALDGNNATCLCYGQTGTGKTWTMLGHVDDAGEGRDLLKPGSGIFLRTLTDLFVYKARSKAKMHVHIMLSIVEIYNEEVRDLLNQRAVLKVREIGDDCAMPELKVEEVQTVEDVYTFYKTADACRSTTATQMNDVSSRSHAVFLIDFLQQARTEKTEEPPTRQVLLKAIGKDPSVLKGATPVTHSRICLVDLAGSERIKKSGVDGKALEEAKAINKSLSALGKVINSLYEGQKHVSYRDSRLTRILKPCFADPAARVLLCANISPTIKSFQETKSTLRFANQVKNIKASGSAGDATAELEFIERLRRMEEMAADVRIASQMHDYRVQCPVRMQVGDEGCVVMPCGSPRRKSVIDAAAEAWREQLREIEQKKREEDARLKERLYKEITEAKMAELAAERSAVEEQLERALREGADLAATCAKQKEEKEQLIKDKTSEAKKVKKKRQEAEQRKEEKMKEDQALAETLSTLERDLAEETRKHQEEFGDDDRAEEEARRRDEVEEAMHRKNAKLIFSWAKLRRERLDNLLRLAELRAEVARLDACAQQVDPAVAYCSSIVRWVVCRAVRTAGGESPGYSGAPGSGPSFTHLSRTLLDYGEWPRRLDVFELAELPNDAGEAAPVPESTQLSDGEEAAPTALPLSRAAKDRHGSRQGRRDDRPSKAPAAAPAGPVQYDFISEKKRREDEARRKQEQEERRKREMERMRLQQERQRKAYERMELQGEVTRYHDEEEADKHYLMGIYDADGLVQDIVRYLQCGTHLVKHGRNGKPHKRKFSINESKTELCWVDEAASETKRSSHQLKEITGIIMGQYSRVFKRQSQCGPHVSGFYNSFTLVVKQGKRTIDCVADTISEFEAWLLGLANLLSLEPVWGAPLRLDMLTPEQRQEDEEAVQGSSASGESRKLTQREVEVGLRHHIRPSLIRKVKQKIVDRRDEVIQNMRLFDNDMEKVYQAMGGIHPPSLDSRGALLVTKGELRYYAGVDIFRTCVLWKLFEEQNLLFDPHFRVPTYASRSGGIGGA